MAPAKRLEQGRLATGAFQTWELHICQTVYSRYIIHFPGMIAIRIVTDIRAVQLGYRVVLHGFIKSNGMQITELQTPRIILRPFSADHAMEAFAWFIDVSYTPENHRQLFEDIFLSLLKGLAAQEREL